MTRKLDLTGIRFGRLVVLRQAESAKSGGIRWECLCDCGNGTVVFRSALGRHTNSCGCLMVENRKTMNITHGMCGSPEYVAFSSMRDRCNNSNDPAWPRYGGRGIQVKFRNLEELVAHIGKRPSAIYSIDRIDNDGHYEPGNVRWATRSEQRNNRRDSVLYELNGVRDTMKGWASKIGIRPSSVAYRIKAGWPIADALTMPATKGVST
jgi:hypothetical protein